MEALYKCEGSSGHEPELGCCNNMANIRAYPGSEIVVANTL